MLNVSNSWKAALLSFPVISKHLTWKIGNGKTLRVGEDSWFSSGPRCFLPYPMIQHLRLQRVYGIHQVANNRSSSSIVQSWVSVEALGFRGEQALVWTGFINLLRFHHIHLRCEADQLVWGFDQSGNYAPSRGFESLVE